MFFQFFPFAYCSVNKIDSFYIDKYLQLSHNIFVGFGRLEAQPLCDFLFET
nr:MAG TPA: hypothetical protein [Caudoviricetes sp.]